MLRRVAAFCWPLRPVLLLVSLPRVRSPVVGVLGLLVSFSRPRSPVVGPLAEHSRGRTGQVNVLTLTIPLSTRHSGTDTAHYLRQPSSNLMLFHIHSSSETGCGMGASSSDLLPVYISQMGQGAG